MSMVDIVGLLIPRTYFAIVLMTRIRAARKVPARKSWQQIALAVLLVIETVFTVVTLETSNEWLALDRLLNGTRLAVCFQCLLAAVE